MKRSVANVFIRRCRPGHAVVAKKPELKNVEPFKTVLSGNREAMAKFTMADLEKILGATLTGMTVEEFGGEVKSWLASTKPPRDGRLEVAVIE